MLHISFENPGIRLVCEDECEAKVIYGPILAKKLQDRLAELNAAVSLNDIVVGKLTVTQNQTYTIDISEGVQLVLVPINRKPKLTTRGEIDLESINRIKIVAITHTT